MLHSAGIGNVGRARGRKMPTATRLGRIAARTAALPAIRYRPHLMKIEDVQVICRLRRRPLTIVCGAFSMHHPRM
jgi:hypothetical protein